MSEFGITLLEVTFPLTLEFLDPPLYSLVNKSLAIFVQLLRSVKEYWQFKMSLPIDNRELEGNLGWVTNFMY